VFQSLSGFQVRCNGGGRDVHDQPIINVSIPIGFSSSLQHRKPFRRGLVSKSVSIPIGFSSSLQRRATKDQELDAVVFQSLSGFQVRCNRSSQTCPNFHGILVSIPIGFSSSLQQW